MKWTVKSGGKEWDFPTRKAARHFCKRIYSAGIYVEIHRPDGTVEQYIPGV